MSRRTQLDARNKRRRELRHLHQARQLELSVDLPPITYQPRGRPPIYASIQDRRNAANARRRVQRQLQRSTNSSIRDPNSIPKILSENRLYVDQQRDIDIARVTNSSFVDGTSMLPPVSNVEETTRSGTNSTCLPPVNSRRRGRPRIYTSVQERRDATNARRRERRRTQQTVAVSFDVVHLPQNAYAIEPTASFIQELSVVLPASDDLEGRKMADSEVMATHKHKKKLKKREQSNLDCSIREKLVIGEDGMQDLEAESDMNGLTMEEKLATLELLSEGKEKNTTEKEALPSKCIPSADSVHVLLKQALHAQDHQLLLNCLSMKDEKVITKSTEILNPSEVLKLLKSLISMIELRGSVLICALPWIKGLLCLHASSIASQESSLQLLNSLYQLIDSRTSTYRTALQLSTCLECLLTEIPEGDEENVAPVIIYEDTDSDDDEGDESDVSMGSDEENEGLGAVIDSAHNSDGSDIMSD